MKLLTLLTTCGYLLYIPISFCQTNFTIKQDALIKQVIEESTYDSVRIIFVGNGDIQKSLSEGSEIKANTGVGVIFFRKWDQHSAIRNIEFDLNINVASTADTVVGIFENNQLLNLRDFGSYLLIPRNSKQAAVFNFNLYCIPKNTVTEIINGLHFQLIGSNSTWVFDDFSTNVAGISTRIGLFHDFIPEHIRLVKGYSIATGLNWTWRFMRGDFSSDNNANLREEIVGLRSTSFMGAEFNITFKLNNMRAEV